MTQERLDFGPPPAALRPAPGDTVVAQRRHLGHCVLKVRGVYALAVTADRIEVLARARDRGEAIPRTRPNTLTYGTFNVVHGAPP